MKITGAKLWMITLHTHEPFKIAFETLTECHGILVELLTEDGLSGYGEASPARRITGETAEGAAQVLKTILIPAVQGMNPFHLSEIHERMDETIQGNPSAKSAVDMACYDLIGKATGQPVITLLGREPASLRTDHTISIKPPQKQAEIAEKLVKDQFKILKIKLGGPPEEDVLRVKTIREKVGHEVILRVDANQGWSVQEAVSILDKIAKYQIELAEQPIHAKNLKGLAWLRKRSPIPIAADEAVHTPEQALQAIELEACDIINIKLMKCGGIYRALQIASIVESAHLSCMIGGMIAESSLAVSAAAHFAGSRPVVRYYDLDADLLLKDNLIQEGGIRLKNGERVILNLPGFGVSKFTQTFLTPI
jgi:L-alanine-DL-glutamate epimerase-like enolase superfamily enzyme